MKEGIFRKGLVFGIIVLFIGASIVSAFSINPADESNPMNLGNWLYVGGSGPGNYSSIQDAIDDANPGDTIFVYDDSSPYYENIIIQKFIKLIGENKETTVILGDESSDGVIVNISADDVSISGFTIQPFAGKPAGIIINKNYTYPDYWNIEIIQNVTISNNIIKNTGWAGIFAIRLNYGNIYGNSIENSYNNGIHLFISSNNQITNNAITKCVSRGIEIDGVWGPYRMQNYRNPVPENNIVSQNTILSNRWGIELNSGPVNTKISDNNISGNHEIGIQLFQASKTQITRNNFIDNSENAYFDAVCVLRYPQFMQNSWNNNFWGEPKNLPVRIKGDFYLMPFPRIPIDIVFPNFSLTQYELHWIAFDWHPAKEPYDIP
jgi:parallel beta-helix repeat protein